MLQSMRGGRAAAPLLFLTAACCGGGQPTAPAPESAQATAEPGSPKDVHSYARPDEVRVSDMALQWHVDFDTKIPEGSVIYLLKIGAGSEGQPLRLDTRDLDIIRVTAGAVGSTSASLPDAAWKLGERDAHLGSELIIEIPPGADRVRVEYRTRPEASGLQWLDPEQTAGKRHPFLYSQSQAIHARSWIPCQDSPGIRTTFQATIEV